MESCDEEKEDDALQRRASKQLLKMEGKDGDATRNASRVGEADHTGQLTNAEVEEDEEKRGQGTMHEEKLGDASELCKRRACNRKSEVQLGEGQGSGTAGWEFFRGWIDGSRGLQNDRRADDC